MNDMLGTDSDAKVAKRLGISASAMTSQRQALSIPAVGQSCKMDDFPGTRAMLGKVTDVEIAKILGVNRSAVVRYRQRRGIAACPRKSMEVE